MQGFSLDLGVLLELSTDLNGIRGQDFRARSWIGSLQLFLKCLFSLGIIYHCSVAWMVPNRTSYLGHDLEPAMKFYIQFFELGTSWSFFAPDPGPPPLFFEWEAFNQKGTVLDVGRWPPVSNSFLMHERQNRRIAAARFMVSSDDIAHQMMTAYLCHKLDAPTESKKIVSLKLWSVYTNLPKFDGILNQTWTHDEPRSVLRHLVTHSFCQELHS